jgi:hypothetical protein
MVGSLSLFCGGNEVRLIPDRLVQNIVFHRRHIAHVNRATHAHVAAFQVSLLRFQ